MNPPEQESPSDEELEELKRRQQSFIDAFGSIPNYEKGDFEPLVGETFLVVGIDGPSQVELKLFEIESRPENKVKHSKNIRRFPFILEFTAEDSEVLADGNYRISRKSDPEVKFMLFIKRLEHVPDENLMAYESVLN